MGILGSVTRYLKTCGRLMYADPQGFGTPSALRRKKKTPQAAYLELLEPRVLMTTVYGGDVFKYTDAMGQPVTVTLTGNVIAELVSAVQAGGASGKNQVASGGYLIFGDIMGTYTAGPRKGVVVGNGSSPVTNGAQGAPTLGNAHITIPGAVYPDPNNNLTGNQVNLQTLSTNLSGQTFTFNLFDVDDKGKTLVSPLDTASKQADWTMQVVQLDNASGAGTVVYTVNSDQLGSLLPISLSTDSVYTYTNVGVQAAAFDPIDNQLYFEFHATFTNLTGTRSTVTNIDEIYSFDPSQSGSTFTDVGAINTTLNKAGQPRYDVTGMAFTLNSADPTTGTLFVSMQPNANGGPPNLKPAPQPNLQEFAVATDGTFDPTIPDTTLNLYEGYGPARAQLTNILGLSVLPGSQDGGGDGYLFALVGTGATTHLDRIDLTTGNSTAWGNTTDIYETTVKKPQAPYDGQSLAGFTYNPTVENPFTGQLGAFMSIDTATTNLDFVNHKLRINAGDVYAVYTAVSDINSSIVFQGANLYQGNSGALGKNASPGNTGTVFIGYKGQIPDNTTNDTFIASTPFLTGQITQSIGVMPGLISDTTDPTVTGGPTAKLFAGLDVAKSLEQTFNPSLSLLSQVLGDAFNNVTGMAIAPDGTIAVVNSYYYSGAAGDQLAFVDPTTGQISALTSVEDIVLNGTSSTPLKNLEGLAYGDPNLDGTSELYAVYDLGDGNGPTLGTISTTSGLFGATAVFTPIGPLGLGAHGKVSSIFFTPGGTTTNPAQESLYVVADPNNWDFDGSQSLYLADLTLTGGVVTNAIVDNAPTYDANGNVVDSGGIGMITDQSGNNLNVVSALFDPSGNALVMDRTSGRLMDLDLTTGLAGTTFASGVGEINPTVAAVALDPATQKFFVVDNLTGEVAAISNTGTDAATVTASAIMMQLADFNAVNADLTSLGKFMVDGTVSGKVTVPGSMDLFYAGWLMTGDAANGGTWIVQAPLGSLLSTTTDSAFMENYFRDNFYIGGDIRNLVRLTNIGAGTANGMEILVQGKIGAVMALGNLSAVVHASNQDSLPNLTDAASLTLSTSLYGAYGYSYEGSASATSGTLELTQGLANQAGSIFSTTLQNIDSFDAGFSFTALSSALGIDGGFAFVLQNQGVPALGTGGTGLGYAGLLKSVALEFNFDPLATNTIGLKTNGTIGYTVNPGFAVSSGDTINVNLSYNGSTLIVTVADATLLLNYSTSFTVDLPTIMGAHGAYVGFTGASGTVGNITTITAMSFGGFTPGQMQMAQEELQHYQVDITDYPSFAAGWLVDTAAAAPFDNSTFATAQYLGTVDNAVPGQPNVIHLQGTLEAGPQPKTGGFGRENEVDYFAFGVMAGQTITVSVTPRVPTGLLAGAMAGLVHFAIFDPDGNLVQSDYNWLDSTSTEDRAITFTADRPGAYRVAITNSTNTAFAGGTTPPPGNTAYDLKITGAGVGNMAIGAVVVGGAVNLHGSLWTTSSTASTDFITNPSIWADTGDVGAIQAGGNITSQVYDPGLVQSLLSQGYTYTGSSSSDIFVANGDLRSVVGANIGILSGNPLTLTGTPDINVSGNVGLLATTGNVMLSATFSRAARNIQMISSAADLEGVFRANAGIGVIRAATVTNEWAGLGWTTEFHADADRQGADGIIDMIDVSGDWGALVNGGREPGAALVTGPGGNVRFMTVGGYLSQDSLFNNGITGTTGEIVHAPGPVSYVDDSGVFITLTPSSIVTVAATGGTLTTAGILTTRTYGVRGAGGVVILDVTSTTGLTINASASGAGRTAEIGSVTVQGAGVPVTVVNGVPIVNGTAGTVGLTVPLNYNDVRMTANSPDASVNVYNINGGVIDTLSNTTAGDIYNVTAGDIGTLSSKGNIGVMPVSKTGTALIPLTTFAAGVFPFVAQNVGISAGNVGLISAYKAIGNVVASGVIGTITPNSDNVDDPNVFEGLVGPIVINGTAVATSSTGTTIPVGATSNIVTANISITKVNIGEGIPTAGNLPNGFKSGIYAAGKILQVTGTNADIRGNILSLDSIGTVTLTNGSIINTHVAVYTQWQMAETFNTTAITMPGTSTIDAPVYLIDSVNIQGNGGIISSVIDASSINSIVVAPTGFGIVNTYVAGTALGTLNNITAGGYGFRSVYLNFATINNITATGTGAVTPLSAYTPRLLASETTFLDPNTGTQPNILTDLNLWMNGDPNSSLLLTGAADPAGLLTGQISSLTVGGQNRLGNVSAYDIRDSSFNFPLSTGAITARHDVFDTEFITGTIKSITIGHDALNIDITAAGSIGPVSIGGNFGVSTAAAATVVSTLSQIIAKGVNGNITSLVTAGSFGGYVLAEGLIGSVTIGSAGAKGLPSTGDFSGTLTVNGNGQTGTILNALKIYGATIGGAVSLTGNVGTIDIAHDLSTATLFTLRGNLASLLVGSDTAQNGSNLAGTLDLTGNLTNAVITGAMSGTLIVEGNLGKFALNSDPVTAGTNLLTGDLSVAGTLTSAVVQGGVTSTIVAGVLSAVTVNGNLAGDILGGKSIAAVTIAGSILAGANVTSSLGNITKLTVNGDINGSVTAPNGQISSITFTGAVGSTGAIAAYSLGAITVPGAVAGTISAVTSITSLKAGSVSSTANISAASLASLTTTGAMNGKLNIGVTPSVKLAIGGNFGGQVTVTAPLSITVGGNMLAGASVTDSNALTSLAVVGSLSGKVVVDQLINAISAATMANAVITAGQGLASLKITGAVTDSLVQAGLSRGIDNIFGTNDLNEQGRMGDLGALAVGSMVNSIIAAGGNINTFVSTGNMSSSAVSAGLVVQGASVAAVLADASPLSTPAKVLAALQSPTLLHGSFKSVSVGAVGLTPTLINSAVTAGVSPGADGNFATAADNNVNTSLTGGSSSIGAFKGVLDAGSRLLANTPTTAKIPALTFVNYTVDGGANSIVPGDPITGAPTVTVTPTTPGTITTTAGTIIIKITGTGGVVNAYDNPLTTDRLDTLLISSTGSTALTVTVTTSAPNAFSLGRVITTDNTQVGSFTFNGDILGDVNGGPSLWFDSDMSALTARNLPNDGTWNGQIGGNVAKLTLNQMGPGKLRIGGRVATLAVTSAVGNPLLQQLGTVTPPTAITQIAYNSLNGTTYATDGNNLLKVDVNSGSINSSSPFTTLLTNATMSVSGLSFDNSGHLFGVATLNNQNPVTRVGAITTTGDTLHGLAVNAQGVIYAIDSQSGVDNLVTLNPTAGTETVLGVIRGPGTNTYTNNVIALAIDQNGNILALLNDKDGNGGAYTPANGVALAKIKNFGNGVIKAINPNTPNNTGDPILITGTATNSFSGLAVGLAGTVNTIYAVQNIAGVQELDTLTLNATASATAVTLTAVGNIKLGASNTQLVGIGADETGTLIGLNTNGSNSELIGIPSGSPAASVRLDVPGLVSGTRAAFAVGKSGTPFTTYSYTTNDSTGGMLFTSPGVVSTLGSIATTGAFTEMLPLAANAAGAPLAGNATGLAADSAGDIFAITDKGELAEYSSVDGSIIGGHIIGIVKDAFGASLDITRISFNSQGDLIGLNANGDNLVKIQQTTTLVGGQNVALATDVTELGTADVSDLTALSFAYGIQKVLSYSTSSGRFVNLLGSTPASIGGIIANSFGAVSLPAAFTGHIGATGGGGVVVSGLDSLKLVGTGSFAGSVSAVNSIGTVAGTGVVLTGSIISHADLKSVALTGSVTRTGVLSADGLLGSFSLTGDFTGHVTVGSAGTIGVKGSLLANSLVAVDNALTTLTVSGQDAGLVSAGSNKTLTVSGALATGASINILGAAGAVTISGGTQLGSLLLAHKAATTITIGGTLAGVVGTRQSLTTANLANLANGVFAVGGDLTTLNVTGNVSNSLIADGVWIGNDGLYNTADDVIYGGSIATAKIGGVFTDSAITAGVLPRLGAAAGTNNIPNTFSIFAFNPNALTLADMDSAESGGIGLSYIQNITFTKPVVSTAAAQGFFSALVAANGIVKVNTPATTAALQQIVRTDPPGAPAIVTATDPVTLLTTPQIVRFAPGEIDVTFTEPLDTTTLNASTIQVANSGTNVPVTDLTFGYYHQAAPDGSTQSVVQIRSASHFNNSTGVIVTLVGGVSAPTITDITGLRSSLLDYDQDGVNELDPFGTQFAGIRYVLGPPSNDNQANAILLAGFPVSTVGTNINATAELGESPHGGVTAGASVWWSWIPTASSPVSVNTSGSDFQTTMSVYDVTQGGISVGESSNIAVGSFSTVLFNAVAGDTYQIAVDGAIVGTGSNATGHIVLNFGAVPAPANDNLASATVLSGLPVNVIDNNFAATAQTDESTHSGFTAASSVWWAWTAPATQAVSINTFGSDFTTAMSVYTNTGTTPSFATLVSVGEDPQNVLLNAVAGTTYYIAVDGQFGETGNITLNILSSAPPANDNFVNATRIIGSPAMVTGNNLFATMETGEPNYDGIYAVNSVWYTWVAPTTGLVTLNAQGSTFSTIVSVYRGSPATPFTALTLVGGGELSYVYTPMIGGGSYYYPTSFMATAGISYMISVAGYGYFPMFYVDTGYFNLSIS